MSEPIAARIRLIRRIQERTLEAVAAQVGMSASTLCRIERGLRPMSVEELDSLLQALGLDGEKDSP